MSNGTRIFDRDVELKGNSQLTKNGNVIIDSDGAISVLASTTAGIAASTIQTQGQQPLTANINEVAIVVNANDVVTLPSAVAGLQVIIINNGVNNLQIFPASGDNINGYGLNISIIIDAGDVIFTAYDSTNWHAGRTQTA